MKTNQPDRRRSGFSLIELLTVIMIIGLMAAMVLPNLNFISGEADRVKDKRNAQNVLLAYTTGSAAGVDWPEGDVASLVTAVIAGQKPAKGSMSSVMFKSSITSEDAEGTYLYIGLRPNGELFFDPAGGQNPAGH